MNPFVHDVGLRFDAMGWLPVAMAIIVLSGAAIWVLQSKWQGGNRSAWWRWLAVSCLALAMTKPVIVRTAAATGGKWVFLLDQSRSMSVSDPQRTLARCVALAQAEGLLQPPARSLVGVDLIDQARSLTTLQDTIETAATELDFAELAGHGIDAAAKRLNTAMQAMRLAAESLRLKSTNQPNAVQLFDTCRAITHQIDSVLLPKSANGVVSLRRTAWVQAIRRLVDSAPPAADQLQDAADAGA